MNPKFIPRTRTARLAWLVEECGDVMQSVGKAGRFGMGSRHPDGGPTNAEAILAELRDLKIAIETVEHDLAGDHVVRGDRLAT